MSIITGKATTKYKGEDTTISVRFRNKTPIEYFIFDKMFGAIQPEFIDNNDFDDFIDRAYQDACKSNLSRIAARAMTTPTQPPKACKTRAAIKDQSSGANTQSKLANAYSAIPK